MGMQSAHVANFSPSPLLIKAAQQRRTLSATSLPEARPLTASPSETPGRGRHSPHLAGHRAAGHRGGALCPAPSASARVLGTQGGKRRLLGDGHNQQRTAEKAAFGLDPTDGRGVDEGSAFQESRRLRGPCPGEARNPDRRDT